MSMAFLEKNGYFVRQLNFIMNYQAEADMLLKSVGKMRKEQKNDK